MADNEKKEFNSKVNSNDKMLLTETEGVLNRLKEACNVKSDTKLATILRIRRQGIGAARKKEKIPHSWIFKISEQTGYSTDWLGYGKGSKKIDERKKDAPGSEGTLYNKVEENAGRVVEQEFAFNRAEKLPDPELKKVFIESIRKLTAYLEKRVEELEKENADLKKQLKEKGRRRGERRKEDLGPLPGEEERRTGTNRRSL